MFSVLATHGKAVLLITVVCTAVAALAFGVHILWGQPVRHTASLDFRPTFAAESGKYPNGVAFSTSDIIATPVLDLVFDANGLGDYCDRALFRQSVFVEERSDQATFLVADYQARFADARLSIVDRERLQAEYEARRQALPVQYRLVLVIPGPCDTLPATVGQKILTEVLNAWASESDGKRGVLSQQVEVLTPSTLDIQLGPRRRPSLGCSGSSSTRTVAPGPCWPP